MSTQVWYFRVETEGTEQAHRAVHDRVIQSLMGPDHDEREYDENEPPVETWWPKGLNRVSHSGSGIDGKVLDRIIEAIRTAAKQAVMKAAERL